MSVDGSPDSLRLFGLSKNTDSSQDLFKTQDLNDGERNVGSPQSTKRPCFRTPNRNSNLSVRSLTATVANSVHGIYCSQEVCLLSFCTLHSDVSLVTFEVTMTIMEWVGGESLQPPRNCVRYRGGGPWHFWKKH